MSRIAIPRLKVIRGDAGGRDFFQISCTHVYRSRFFAREDRRSERAPPRQNVFFFKFFFCAPEARENAHFQSPWSGAARPPTKPIFFSKRAGGARKFFPPSPKSIIKFKGIFLLFLLFFVSKLSKSAIKIFFFTFYLVSYKNVNSIYNI